MKIIDFQPGDGNRYTIGLESVEISDQNLIGYKTSSKLMLYEFGFNDITHFGIFDITREYYLEEEFTALMGLNKESKFVIRTGLAIFGYLTGLLTGMPSLIDSWSSGKIDRVTSDDQLAPLLDNVKSLKRNIDYEISAARFLDVYIYTG